MEMASNVLVGHPIGDQLNYLLFTRGKQRHYWLDPLTSTGDSSGRDSTQQSGGNEPGAYLLTQYDAREKRDQIS